MASGLSVQYDKTQSHRTSFDLNIIIIKQKNLTSTQYPGHKKLFVTRYPHQTLCCLVRGLLFNITF